MSSFPALNPETTRLLEKHALTAELIKTAATAKKKEGGEKIPHFLLEPVARILQEAFAPHVKSVDDLNIVAREEFRLICLDAGMRLGIRLKMPALFLEAVYDLVEEIRARPKLKAVGS